MEDTKPTSWLVIARCLTFRPAQHLSIFRLWLILSTHKPSYFHVGVSRNLCRKWLGERNWRLSLVPVPQPYHNKGGSVKVIRSIIRFTTCNTSPKSPWLLLPTVLHHLVAFIYLSTFLLRETKCEVSEA
ncbi:hypothetical protein V2G26_005223 [Clonostachys chloroleuca]